MKSVKVPKKTDRKLKELKDKIEKLKKKITDMRIDMQSMRNWIQDADEFFISQPFDGAEVMGWDSEEWHRVTNL